MTRRVVVGWDGSTAAAGALDWAMRHCPDVESVEIVEVEETGRQRGRPHGDPEEAAETLRRAHPGLDVTVSLEQGVVARVLADRSTPDGLLVLGGRGHEETRLAHRTSTAYRVVLAARGPVAVVPQSYRGGRDVVVGVVSPSDSRSVVLAAAAEAARRHQRLIAVHVVATPLGIAALPGDPVGSGPSVRDYEPILQEVLAPVTEVYPELPVVRHVVRGRPSDVLLAESRRAALLVLGREVVPPATGHPVTQSSMLLSRAPVMVVPPETEVS